MSAPQRIYQQLVAQIKRCAPELRLTSARRLAVLVAGIAASKACALRRVARKVRAMGLSRAQPASIARRLRRTVADLRLDAGAGYTALLREAIPWPANTPVPLVLDESTTPGGVHVRRLSLALRWAVLSRYARRFWIEAAFQQDKSHGWDWAHSQVRQPAHQDRLLLALAWASVLVLSLGAQEAATALAARRGARARPTPPRDRLFTLGLNRLQAGFYGTARGPLPWRSPRLRAPSWCAQYVAGHPSPTQPQFVLP